MIGLHYVLLHLSTVFATIQFSSDFTSDTGSLLRKSFQTHEASYRDLIARAFIEHTLVKRSAHIPSSPRTTAETQPSNSTTVAIDEPICIIGAGAAGLYTAMILEDLGLKYEILEASDQIGGRVLTHRFNGETGFHAPRDTPERYDYFDIGAMRFPNIPFQERVFDLFERIGVQDLLIPYTLHHGNNLLYYNLQPPVTAKDAKTRTVDYFRVSVDNHGIVPNSFAEAGSNHWLDMVYEPFKKPFAGMNDPDPQKQVEAFSAGWANLTRHDHLSVRGYMLVAEEPETEQSRPAYPESVVHWLETMDTGTGIYDQGLVEAVIDSLDFGWPYPSVGLSPASLLQVGGQVNEGKLDLPWYCIDGGTDHITRAMAKKLNTKPILNQTVFKIEHIGDTHMKVAFRDGNGHKHSRVYSHVISTVTLGSLQTINTDHAGLLYGQREAIRALSYEAATKIGIKFEKRWWQDPEVMGKDKIILGGQSYTDIPIRTCVYPSYGLNCSSPPGVLLASYNIMQDALRFGSLAHGKDTIAEGDLLEITIDNLERLHGIPRAKFGPILDYKAHSWYNDRYTRGAWAHFGPGQYGSIDSATSLFASLKAPAAQGRFHIAGEATSMHHAWILGALNSAWRAVHNALIDQPEKRQLLVERWGTPDEEDGKALVKLSALAANNML